MTLRQMEYFVAVAERGSIAAAAAQLPISESAVSVAISELESIVGVRLLHRVRARGVTLTAAGMALLPELRSLVARARELERNAADIGGAVAGELKVALDPVLTPVLLPGLMSGFLSRYPAVNFSFMEGNAGEAQDWLSQGRCDVVLMYDLDVREDLSAHPLFTVRPKVLVAESFVGSRDRSISLRSLESEPMILIDISPGEAFYRAILSSAKVTPRVAHQTSNVEGVRALVARGFGWSMLLQHSPTNVSYEGRAFRELDIAEDVPEVALLAVTERGHLTRRTVAFRDYCTKHFAAGD
jgi:DNA-binding transcriptional LysR family regulator